MWKRNTITLRTDLNVEECLRRLREGTDIGRRTIFSLSGFRGSKPVLSKFDGNKFRLWKRRWYNNGFAPFFFGTLSAEERGTRIEGRFGMAPLVRPFQIVWLVLAGVSSLPIFFTTLAHPIRGDDWLGIVIPLGLLFVGAVMPEAGRIIGKGEERFLREFLETTLVTRAVDSGLPLSSCKIQNVPL